MSSKQSQACLILTVVLATTAIARPESQQPPAPVPGPSLTEALKALEAARTAATRIGVKVSCAVVDSRGDLIALTRMDGAQFFVADIARGKAQVSAMFGQPSANLVQFGASSSFSNLNTVAQGRLYAMPGAVPISRSNQVIGAIGCSGATGEQDIEAAKAGLAVF